MDSLMAFRAQGISAISAPTESFTAEGKGSTRSLPVSATSRFSNGLASSCSCARVTEAVPLSTFVVLSSVDPGTMLARPSPQSMRQASPPRSSRSILTAPAEFVSPRKLMPALQAACSDPHRTIPAEGYAATEIVWPRAATTIWRCASREELTQSPKLPFAFIRNIRTACMRS